MHFLQFRENIPKNETTNISLEEVQFKKGGHFLRKYIYPCIITEVKRLRLVFSQKY